MPFAEVILPLPLNTTFTYGIPAEMSALVKVGHRVIVPFGRKKFYTAIVVGISFTPPSGFEVKDIAVALDDKPVLRHPQLKLWNWVASYYMSAIGDVFKAALPSGLRIENETFIEIDPEYEEDPDSVLSEREAIIIQILDHEAKRLTVAEIEKKTGLRHVSAVIGRLLEKGAVIISERLVERYRSLKEVWIRPLIGTDSISMQAAFDAVKGAPKQETALLAIIDMALRNHQDRTAPGEVSKKSLIERTGINTPIINALEKKGLIQQYKKVINRFHFDGNISPTLPQLTSHQKKALDELHKSWAEKDICLLHGVTSSGKTEIYIHLIDYVLKQNKQVLYLVPEIALTTQLTHRLQKVFGNNVIIYHSKFTDNERVDIWKRMLEMKGTPAVIIGARSSLFLPFDHLGLVIVDEEHESSYKQQDPAPRYNGRDVAMVLASMHGAKTLLGSATPSIDTYYKALSGRYGLVSLPYRYNNASMPRVTVADMRTTSKGKYMPQALASESLTAIRDSLTNNRQAIIFINRRGYAPIARCKVCAHVPKCENCDVSLTYHRSSDRLVCHYCGATYPMPQICPVCKEHSMEIVGYGTERLEDEISQTFSEAVIDRMDLDSTRSKEGYSKIIDKFSSGKSQILIGTQMVTKGLDFGNVGVVAVVNADSVLNYPDFRSAERAYDMIEQVAGRAGRKDGESIVTIQTWDPDNRILSFVINHDYKGFYEFEINQRKDFNYPPFCRLIYIYLKHTDDDALTEIAAAYTRHLTALFGTRVLGPEEPTVSRVRSLYIRRIMLKIEAGASISKVKKILMDVQDEMYRYPAMKSTIIYYDVDPM